MTSRNDGLSPVHRRQAVVLCPVGTAALSGSLPLPDAPPPGRAGFGVIVGA